MSYANHANDSYDSPAYPTHKRVPLVARLPLRISLTIGCLFLLFLGVVASNIFVATAQWKTSMDAISSDLNDARYGGQRIQKLSILRSTDTVIAPAICSTTPTRCIQASVPKRN